MITKLTSQEELAQIIVESMFNRTTKVNKISPNSVLSGFINSSAKVGQKAIKDIANIEGNIFPDYGIGSQLDTIADTLGIAPRFSASKASTWVLIKADEGTQYLSGTHIFKGNNGIEFDLINNVTIDSNGYGYGEIRSINTGIDTNILPYTINQVSPSVDGHDFVTNEFMASGGRDIESDDDFRQRIKEGPSILSRSVRATIEQAFIKINPDVLKIFVRGLDTNGKLKIEIATVNGSNLSQNELDDLLERGEEFFSLNNQRRYSSDSYNITLSNISYQYVDFVYRVSLLDNVSIDDYRKNVQIAFSRKIDYRTIDRYDKLEWEDFFFIAKNTPGVKYIPDSFFEINASKRTDLKIERNKLPRTRGFRLLDLDGNALYDSNNVVPDTFYPNDVATSFNATVLRNI